jgi:hypothetical protein
VETVDFDRLTRDELVARARALGAERAELMTRVELRDEIVRRAEPDPLEQRRARGWLGVARDMVASVVESGLNLPDAAALIRGRGEFDGHGPPPVATVTLAQIYAAQGHHARAISVLDEVLAKEPDHVAAKELRQRFLEASRAAPAPRPTLDAEAEPVFDTLSKPPQVEKQPHVELPEVAVFEASPPEVAETPAAGPATFAGEPAPFVAATPAPAHANASAPLENGENTARLPVFDEVDPSHAPTFVPVPPRPRRAACVLVSRSSDSGPELVWELGDLAAPTAGGPTLIRYAVWTVSAEGTVRSDGELVLTERRGRARLTDVAPAAVVRAVLGQRRGQDFVPLLIASEVAVAEGAVHLRFRPPATAGVDVQPFERELLLSASEG